mmetsp:Transcript_19226/g.53943  ORF Transcript_19226/g.53943 Transcript_19226/m.53943 type:complete len:496 (-) Transcript_19226:645-2132(-)
MLVLFESPAGYGLFKVLDEGKLKEPENLWKEIGEAGKAQEILSLLAFKKFDGTVDALEAATAAVEGKVGKGLKKFLKSAVKKYDLKDDVLGVVDTKLGGEISKKLKIKVIHDEAVDELTRAIRQHTTLLVDGLEQEDLNAMTLGLAHSLSRYKLKFSPDKVDTMIVQAIGLLDDLDKELNNYVMRVREWYGWHFPELVKIVSDNYLYARVALCVKNRAEFTKERLPELVEVVGDEEKAEEVMKAMNSSMGQDISPIDLINIQTFSQRVISLAEYRQKLYDYLLEKMHVVAPNLSALIGEVVGARLIQHAGSLTNLAKYPASTVQILGAEKALFRALKTRGNTPKYGLIFHSSFIGRAKARNKGRISRYLANKCSIASRIDAFMETTTQTFGEKMRDQVEERLRFYEEGVSTRKNVDVMAEAMDEFRKDNPEAVTPARKKKRSADDDLSDGEDEPKKKRSKGGGEAKTPKSEKKAKKDKKDKTPKSEKKKKRKDKD